MGIPISGLPSVSVPALTDLFPIEQGGVTYKETVQQLSTLIGNANVLTITGTANQVIASSPTGAVTLSLPQSIATTSAVTFGSVAFSPTTQGIVGTTTNDNAATGYVGQFISSVVPGASAVSISASTPTNLTSISVPAGDWNVWGNITFLPTSSTSVTGNSAWVSTTSATLPDASILNTEVYAPGGSVYTTPNTNLGSLCLMQRFSFSTTTTVYLSAYSTFTLSTLTMCGGIYARRIR